MIDIGDPSKPDTLTPQQQYDWDQVIAEALERCANATRNARRSGLNDRALRAFARSQIEPVFGSAWKILRRYLQHRSYARLGLELPPDDRDVDDAVTDNILDRVNSEA